MVVKALLIYTNRKLKWIFVLIFLSFVVFIICIRRGSLFEIEDKIIKYRNFEMYRNFSKTIDTTNSKTTVKPMKLKILKEIEDMKYVPDVAFGKRAFLTSEEVIMVPLVTTRNFLKNNELWLENLNISGEIKCQWGRRCPEYYTRGCIFTGFVAKFKSPMIKTHFLDKLTFPKEIYLRSLNSKKVFILPLLKSFKEKRTIDTSYKHFLSVFVQPMYLMSDFHVIIQFFEYWISQGATKIYIGRTSHTMEVDEIIRWYNESEWIEIEYIEWPKLPIIYRERNTLYNKYNQKFNPNLYTFQNEAILSIYDSMLYIRSLKESKYVAVFDWDEIVMIHNFQNSTVSDFLRNEESLKEEIIGWSFESRRMTIKNNYSINKLEDINFLSYESGSIDKKTFKRPAYQKNIYRLEKFSSFHVHLIQKTINPKMIRYVDNKEAEIYHLRRIPDIEPKIGTIRTDALKYPSQLWTQNFKLRLQLKPSILEKKTWNNYFNKIARNLENCRQQTFKENFSHKYKLCVSIDACSNYLKLDDDIEWIHSTDKWFTFE
uniref:Glycosyltransferase family 92 protein n=1 Tax=Parastrongyloides trichosuri TaxID=131310 RepID=A0A0N4ZF13_PARTI